ncbi:MAG TPA: hypothetical protein VFB03_00550 [Candidatus Saccharimonadales bacterium]|nr:hypothetical protein [Candidatus Saccharimonadales bacterium]
MLGVTLRHYLDFKNVLENYKVSDRAKSALEGLKVVLLLAPTSTGRNTIIQDLLQSGKYYYLVSDTTRKPRVNDGVPEVNGREYWFRTEEEFLEDLKKGEYLEAELIHDQQVSGISIRELEKARQENKVAITDIDIEGVHNVLRTKEDAIVVMLLPPSFEEWMRRISSRGKMQDEELKRRLQTAKRIFEDGLKQDYYHFVIAGDIKQSALTIDAITEGKLNPQEGQTHGIIERLQYDLDQKLEAMRTI